MALDVVTLLSHHFSFENDYSDDKDNDIIKNREKNDKKNILFIYYVFWLAVIIGVIKYNIKMYCIVNTTLTIIYVYGI